MSADAVRYLFAHGGKQPDSQGPVPTQLLTLGAGVFAAGALIFTARNFTLSRRTVELTRQTFELTEQGQVTERYTRASERLGSDKLDVQIGSIYGLERIRRTISRGVPGSTAALCLCLLHGSGGVRLPSLAAEIADHAGSVNAP
jgi:hypothetical protein